MCYGRMRRKKNRRLILEAITMSRSNVEKEQAKEGREKRERKRRQYDMHYRSHLQTSTDLKRLVLDFN